MSLLGCYHRGEIRNPVIYKKQNVCDNTTGSQSIQEFIANNKGEWVIPNGRASFKARAGGKQFAAVTIVIDAVHGGTWP